MSKRKQSAKPGKPKSTSLFRDGTYDTEEFHQTFLECDDPTEYKAALLLVGSWQEWVRLKDDSIWFRAQVHLWLEELEIKQRSDAIEKVLVLAASDKASAFQANKWIGERGYAKISERGRPSKEVLAREAKVIAEEASESKKEAERVEAALIGHIPQGKLVIE